MKARKIAIFALILTALTASSLPAALAEGCAWTGTWVTNYGRLDLLQSGSSVAGTFPGGALQGIVDKTRLTGSWWSDDLEDPAQEGFGDFELNLTGDCSSFEGKCLYGSGKLRGHWSGGRAKTVPADDPGQPLAVPLPADLPPAEGGTWNLSDLDVSDTLTVVEGDTFLGIAEAGELRLLRPYRPLGLVRLTTISMQEARAPESAEIDLGPYEGRAVMVQGRDGGGWIYSARLIDRAGPILTAVVLELFDKEVPGPEPGGHAGVEREEGEHVEGDNVEGDNVEGVHEDEPSNLNS